MSLFEVALFIHILGAVIYFGGHAALWISFLLLRQAKTMQQVPDLTLVRQIASKFFPPGGILLIISGLYLAYVFASRQRPLAWIGVAFISTIVMGIVGGNLFEKRMTKAEKSILQSNNDNLRANQQKVLQDPVLITLLTIDLSLSLGVLSLMVFKPKTVLVASIVVLASGLLGWLIGRYLGNRQKPLP